MAGPNQWMTSSTWLFDEAPDEGLHGPTLPVLAPEDVATRIILADLEDGPTYVLTDFPVVGAGLRRWRWLAFQQSPNSTGKGRFPWEAPLVEG